MTLLSPTTPWKTRQGRKSFITSDYTRICLIRSYSFLLQWTLWVTYTMTYCSFFSDIPITRLVLWLENWPRNRINFVFFTLSTSVTLRTLFDFIHSLDNTTLHISPSLHSLSSFLTSSYSFPSLLSSTLCLSDTWCANIFKAPLASINLLDCLFIMNR